MPPTAEITNQEVWDLYKEYGTVEAVADKLGLGRHEVSPIIDEMPLRQVYRHVGESHMVHSDEKLIGILKDAAAVCHKCSGDGTFKDQVCDKCNGSGWEPEPYGPLTLPFYHALAPRFGWPAALTMIHRLGGDRQTWEAACERAGVKANPGTGPRIGTITVEDCLKALRICRADLIAEEELPEGGEPSYERYVKWARANKQPSGPTIRSKIGPWRKVLELAYGE